MEVRPTTTIGEFASALGAIGHYFGGWPDAEAAERFSRNLPLERMHAAFDGERVVGGAGAFPFELTVPGGQLGCGGVTVVGVYPTHRRRGVLTRMMRAQLEEIRGRGEPLAALWASEEPIYRRFGYGLASLGCEMALQRGYHGLRLAQNPAATVRLISLEEAKQLVPPIYDRIRLATPGMFVRTPDWWELRILDDPPDRREDGAAKNVAVLELDGKPAGYALYRVISKWDSGQNVGHVRVLEAMAEDAELELWRFLFGLDWVETFRGGHLPTDHPLLHGLTYPRRLKLRIGDQLWLRLVDVGAALAARSYVGQDTLVLDVADDFLPQNAGSWRVGATGVERTDDPPDLALGVQELASIYLGGFGATELARAGLVRELTAGAATRANTLFATPRKPWTPEIF
jgi:predicted acetyltransferase